MEHLGQQKRKRDHAKGFVKEVGYQVVENKLDSFRENIIFEVVEIAVKKVIKNKVNKDNDGSHLLGSANYSS